MRICQFNEIKKKNTPKYGEIMSLSSNQTKNKNPPKSISKQPKQNVVLKNEHACKVNK